MLGTIVIFLLVGILLRYLWNRKRFIDSLPPGPFSLPVVGNLLQVDRKDPRKTFLKWYKQYGPIFTVWVGLEPYIMIADHDMMTEAFVKRGDEFSDRPYVWTFDFFTRGLYGILNNFGDQWKEQRRFTLHTLKNFGFGRNVMEKKIAEETEKLLQQLENKFGSSKSKTISVKKDLELCVGNIISSILVGHTYEPNDPTFVQLKQSIEEITQIFSSAKIQMLNNCFLLRFVPLFGHFGFDEMSKQNDIFLDILINELKAHKEKMNESTATEPDDFATAYLMELKKRKEAKDFDTSFSEWQLICIMGDVWPAGMETTVTTLLWGLLLMIHNRKCQERVQKEIDEIIGNDRLPEMSDMAKMPYTSATIHEIQRYSNILPFNVPHAVSQDVTFAGYTIPKGTGVIPAISVLHMDEKLFPNPQTFQPERFLESDGKTLKKTDYLLPFSIGKRICLGESLARMELFIIFAALLQKFSFAVDETAPKPSLDPVVGFISTPVSYNVEMTLRNV